jgi:hypothetical protein
MAEDADGRLEAGGKIPATVRIFAAPVVLGILFLCVAEQRTARLQQRRRGTRVA